MIVSRSLGLISLAMFFMLEVKSTSQEGDVSTPEDEVLCFKNQDKYACNQGVPHPFCSDRKCRYEIVAWEQVEVFGVNPPAYVERPVLEWFCADDEWNPYTGATAYDRFDIYQSCEVTNDNSGMKYDKWQEKEVKPVCFYIVQCAGCSVGSGVFTLGNRNIEGGVYNGDPGVSVYSWRECDSSSHASDQPFFADVNECIDPKGACPPPAP